MSEILIVDDDAGLRASFARVLTMEGHAIRVAGSGEAGLAMFKEKLPDVVVMDVRMPGMTGVETFERMRAVSAEVPVIIMTAFGTTEMAIAAVNKGAFEFVLKPFDIPDMLAHISKALEAGRVMRDKIELDSQPSALVGDALVGKSRIMQEVYKAIGRVAATDATVLIRGESGVGKELVARAIYNYSRRADKPFAIINCVAIPDTLLESELFGYERGAFTGATASRAGKIERARGGTIFLDEIGDVPLPIQAKLLRLLQEKTIERLGSRETVSVDARIVAATNRDLEAAMREGTFREDLFYRLSVVVIDLPPLRLRKEDIPLLAEHFLNRHSAEMSLPNPGLGADALPALMDYDWPGNVREFSNAARKALIFSRGAPLTAADFLTALDREKSASVQASVQTADGETDQLTAWIRARLETLRPEEGWHVLRDEFERAALRETLRLAGGNRSRAARALGLSRPTLQSKLEKLGFGPAGSDAPGFKQETAARRETSPKHEMP